MRTEIKIGGFEYTITNSDRFMDNGACVQLLTQSKGRSSWGSAPAPVLSKKLYKDLLKKHEKTNVIDYGNYHCFNFI